jgi:hypothetical protein
MPLTMHRSLRRQTVSVALVGKFKKSKLRIKEVAAVQARARREVRADDLQTITARFAASERPRGGPRWPARLRELGIA